MQGPWVLMVGLGQGSGLSHGGLTGRGVTWCNLSLTPPPKGTPVNKQSPGELTAVNKEGAGPYTCQVWPPPC